MGVYGFVCAGGGSIGVLLGGLLTSALSWHWIFLINLPLGAVAVLMFGLNFPAQTTVVGHKVDWLGAALLAAGFEIHCVEQVTQRKRESN
jgi:MFS family permease